MHMHEEQDTGRENAGVTSGAHVCTGTVQVDAHNVMLTLCEFSYVALPFGIATAATIRTGNMLGAGNHASARRSGVSPLPDLL